MAVTLQPWTDEMGERHAGTDSDRGRRKTTPCSSMFPTTRCGGDLSVRIVRWSSPDAQSNLMAWN